MTASEPPHEERVEPARRLAACLSLGSLALAVLLTLLGLHGQLWRLAVCLGLLVVASVAGWVAATRRHLLRIVGIVLTVGSAALVIMIVLTGTSNGLLAMAVLALIIGSMALTRFALRRDRRAVRELNPPGTSVGPARHGVLIVNPGSGSGTAKASDLADEARRRGIEAVVLDSGSDLVRLAQDAVDRGADVIGVAGGDGSQGPVVSVALRCEVAFVCVPTGTRNHFALDLGLDRDDFVGALDAFGDAVERRIDVGQVGDRVFVNNVSLGVYPRLVEAPDYRGAKAETIARLLPDLLGPDAPPFGMRFADASGNIHDGAQLIEVSNNPYRLTHLTGFGTRARLDTGTLGVTALEVRGGADVTELLARQIAGRPSGFGGYVALASPTFRVDADSPVHAGVDGEPVMLDPPLEIRSLPRALRVRIPLHAPGHSPAALSSGSSWWTLRALFRTVVGLRTPIDESER